MTLVRSELEVMLLVLGSPNKPHITYLAKGQRESLASYIRL